jgi:hypothetical protein
VEKGRAPPAGRTVVPPGVSTYGQAVPGGAGCCVGLPTGAWRLIDRGGISLFRRCVGSLCFGFRGSLPPIFEKKPTQRRRWADPAPTPLSPIRGT